MELRYESDDPWQAGDYKQREDVARALEERARSGQPMSGFKLDRAELQRINLVNRGSQQGYVFRDCDFYRANFEQAHCFKVDFSGCSLMKANFRNANLHCANLEGCNLLGTCFSHAKLEHVNWGEKMLQEYQAELTQIRSEQIDFYQQAEEIYRHLRKASEEEGLFELAGRFFKREMVCRRKQHSKFSLARMISKIVDLFCGYGEEPLRVIIFTNVLILIYAVLYFFTGLSQGSGMIGYQAGASLAEHGQSFLNALYFSVVTFTTLGYGDITPLGWSRVLAACEALMGSFTIALFVVVFVKKMTR